MYNKYDYMNNEINFIINLVENINVEFSINLVKL